MERRNNYFDLGQRSELSVETTVFKWDPQIAQRRLEKFKKEHVSATEILMACRS